MLSPSGRADEIVRDLDGEFTPHGNELTIDYLNCHLGNLAVAVRGGVRVSPVPGRPGAPTIAEFVAANYGVLASQGAAAIARFGAFDEPVLRIVLTPSDSHVAQANTVLFARGLKLAAPVNLQSGPLEADAELPIANAAAADVEIFLSATEVESPDAGGVSVGGLSARLRGRLAGHWWQSGSAPFAAVGLDAAAARFSASGVAVDDPVAVMTGTAPIGADVTALLWSQPLSVRATVDLARRSADCRFDGAVGPAAVDAVGARIHRDLRRFVSFTSPIAVSGEARFDPGWKFARAAAWVEGRGITARGVTIDEARGRLEYDGRRLAAPEAFARVGENFARGTYEQDVGTRDYRFLLVGRLRPLAITPWIAGAWWKEFFSNFEFPAEPPAANLDLRGCWTNGRKAVVFVSVDSVGPVVRGVAFDRVRTRLFTRPQFKDGLELDAVRGTGTLSGTFTHRMDFDDRSRWNADLDLASTISLDAAAKILGPLGERILGPFAFARPPSVRVTGHLDGPGNPGGAHTALHIEAATDGAFRYEHFPLEQVAFTAEVRDDTITVSPLSGAAAGGRFTGRAKVWGRDAGRRLSFEATVSHANLAQAIATLEAYSAERSHRTPPALADFLKEKSDVHLDVTASAEGRFSDPFSFQGAGTATVQGPELGQVRMFGLLSELLRFTALRFTSARASFKIDGRRLDFPNITVTGANSGIMAHGTYAMDRHELDFNARIDPFQESKAFAQKFIDVMITPITSALEVKLTGNIEKPRWMFMNGPSNLLRNLGQAGAPAPGPAAPPLK